MKPRYAHGVFGPTKASSTSINKMIPTTILRTRSMPPTFLVIAKIILLSLILFEYIYLFFSFFFNSSISCSNLFIFSCLSVKSPGGKQQNPLPHLAKKIIPSNIKTEQTIGKIHHNSNSLHIINPLFLIKHI